jgi:hypothetical protein
MEIVIHEREGEGRSCALLGRNMKVLPLWKVRKENSVGLIFYSDHYWVAIIPVVSHVWVSPGPPSGWACIGLVIHGPCWVHARPKW